VTRILFVYRYCTMGGVETGLRFRIEALPARGIEAHALFLRDYGGRPTFEGLDGRVFFGASEAGFVDLIDARRYDLISVIDSFDVLEWIDKMDYAGKVMVELRSTYEHTLVHLKRLGDHRIDAILVPSKFQAENVRPYLPRKLRDGIPCHVAHNFVNLENFHPESPSAAPPNRRIVCWVGRIDPLKNWPDFLAIADRLADRDDVEFWMVGGGGSKPDMRTDFRKALGKTRIAARLRWWPLLPNARMPLLYHVVAASGGTVVLTTKCESFGFAALESMACGCPLVAAGVGALPEVVEDGRTGLLYKPGDVAQAADLVAGLLDDESSRQRLAKTAAADTRDRFSPDRCAAAFADAVNRTIEPSAPSDEG